MLASLTMFGLGIFGPSIASGLVAGAPQLGAGAALGTTAGAAGITMLAGGAAVGGARALGGAALGAVRAGTAMGSAASTAYTLGKETASSPTMAAGLGGVARAAGNAARDRASSALGLGEAASQGRAAAWNALNNSGRAEAESSTGADGAPAWARAMRVQQTARHHRQVALHALQQGDRGGASAKRTHILVKPFTSGLATNLVVTTDRRSYHLQLTATSRTGMAALSWTYPADQLIALRRAADPAAAAAPVSEGLAIDSLHFNYAISGDAPAWRPLRAFDDGRQTFVEFPASIAVGDAPPLFVVGPTGEAELVNYRVRGRFYVVDRIFDAAELRLGTRKQQVVRIARNGDGAPSRKGKRS